MDEKKIISMDDALDMIHSGCTIMIGGFAGSEAPNEIIQGIVKRNTKELTLICNDTGDLNIPGEHVGILTPNHCIKKAIVSHIGMNKFTVDQFNKGEIEVEFVPQGTLVERIRAGGYGLGGVLTPTGIGTDIAKGKEIISVDGKEYLLEKPLRADVC
ncbi:CoA transferase subunit A, partial [Klebsiella pneumoniae]